jgi:hypothetical protein
MFSLWRGSSSFFFKLTQLCVWQCRRTFWNGTHPTNYYRLKYFTYRQKHLKYSIVSNTRSILPMIPIRTKVVKRRFREESTEEVFIELVWSNQSDLITIVFKSFQLL